MGRFRKSSATRTHIFDGQHRFEHWYRDDTVYFITSRCRDKFPAFASDQAAQIFWDRFNHYTQAHGFVPWATTLLNNHYHTVGYLRKGEQLGPMMRKLHGSVGKLVNDILPERHLPLAHRGSPGLFRRMPSRRTAMPACVPVHTPSSDANAAL